MDEARIPKSRTSSELQVERRRTQRVQIAMPVLVRGTNGQKKFEEATHTVSINAHGCMLRLAAHVTRSQEVHIVNPKTAEELPCKVTFLGQRDTEKMEVGVEFIEPSPLFWRIAFPPEDWDPSERKRPTTSHKQSKPQR